jgi:2-keto-3-deoxy-L-rhamnonate aldolase RhmA
VLQNKLKRALREGTAVFGVGVTFPLDIAMLRTLEVCGVEWLFLDLEHGSGDISGLLDVAQVSKLLGMDGVARIPNLDYHWVSRALDTGLLSVMIPRVEHREQAELAVQWVKHPPLGIRGMGSPSQFDYSTLPPADRVEVSNRETMVVLQIETVEAVDNVEAIASVPGVDALFIGPLDLSLTLGIPGNVASDQSHDLFRRVCQAARRHGLAVGIVCTAQQVRLYYDMGMRMFSIGTALSHMRTQVQSVEAEFRRQLA